MPFRYVEDEATADLALEVWGRDLPELFRDAADAVTNAMVDDLTTLEERETVVFELEDEALDLAFFSFLQRLVYEKDAALRLLRVSEVSVEHEGDRWRVRARAVGEQLDPRRHGQRVDVKAVTLHRLSVAQVGGIWRAFVILDV